jgi:hypothetical protein
MFRKLDIYPKFADSDVKVKTVPGAILTILTAAAMLILFSHELYRLVKPRTFDEVAVDTSRIGLMRTMPVSFNITISVPCNNVHLDAFDYEGNQQASGRHDIRRQRIDENGIAIQEKEWLTREERREKGRAQRILDSAKSSSYCGSCYGAGKKGQCCNSCDDVIEAHKARGLPVDPAESFSRWQQCVDEGYASLGKESCIYWGSVRVARVQGALFLSLIHDIKPFSKKTHDVSRISRAINLSHTIRSFQFGTPVPGSAPPLDGVTVLQAEKGLVAYNYHLSVVPMRWLSRRGFEVNTFKYSVAFSQKNITARISRDVPGIYFHYDIAPFAVISKETAYTLWQFVTSVCAIVGGAFTCALFADQFLYRAMSTIEAKRQIGKDQ